MSASPAHTKIDVVRRETLQKYEVSYKNATERGDLMGGFFSEIPSRRCHLPLLRDSVI